MVSPALSLPPQPFRVPPRTRATEHQRIPLARRVLFLVQTLRGNRPRPTGVELVNVERQLNVMLEMLTFRLTPFT